MPLLRKVERLLLSGLPRRLPWQDEPKLYHRVGLVPLLCYRVGLLQLGWILDRKMPEGMRGSFWEKAA